MEKTVFSISKYLRKLKVRAKQKDGSIVSKTIEKSDLSDDDKFLLSELERSIYFER